MTTNPKVNLLYYVVVGITNIRLLLDWAIVTKF